MLDKSKNKLLKTNQDSELMRFGHTVTLSIFIVIQLISNKQFCLVVLKVLVVSMISVMILIFSKSKNIYGLSYIVKYQLLSYWTDTMSKSCACCR